MENSHSSIISDIYPSIKQVYHYNQQHYHHLHSNQQLIHSTPHHQIHPIHNPNHLIQFKTYSTPGNSKKCNYKFSTLSQNQNHKIKIKNNNKIIKINHKLPISQQQSSITSNPLNIAHSSHQSNICYGPNFGLIPLCCRTYFFDLQRILPAQNKRIQFKSYKFPFNPASIETLKKTICAFINTIGGQIYIGVKQTTNKKYRYVLGNYLTQNDKEQVIKTFRKISENIFPNCTESLQIEFVPIRENPFPNIDLIGHSQTYFYDFTQRPLDLNKYGYLPARYMIRVKVAAGNKNVLHSYVQTEFQLNKNSTSNEFISFRSQNQVLVKEISQEVLRKYKQRLLYEKQISIVSHQGPCLKPEIGNPKNEPEGIQNMIDAKKIEAVLYEYEKKKQTEQKGKYILPDQVRQKIRDKTKNKLQVSKQKETNNLFVTQDQLKMIFKYPLTFIVNNISEQKLKKCIMKTPAKQFTQIQKVKNSLSQGQILIITVEGYHRMEQFLRIKASIEKYYQKNNAEIVGVSKTFRIQNLEVKRILQSLLQQKGHKCAVRKKYLEFYTLTNAASYFLYMRELGYQLEIVPE